MVSLDGDKDKCSRTMWRNSLDWLGRSVLQFFFKRRSYFSTECGFSNGLRTWRKVDGGNENFIDGNY